MAVLMLRDSSGQNTKLQWRSVRLTCTEELLQFWGVGKCLNCKAVPPGKVWRAISTRRQREGAGACTAPSKYIQEFSDG